MEAQVFRVFAKNGINMQKGDVGGRPGGPHHVVARLRAATLPYGVASPWPLSDSPPDSGYVLENRDFGLRFIQFR